MPPRSTTTLTILAAVAENGVIGRGNDLPWKLPDDLRRFKRLTMGGPVILGRRTYESIGRPLPGRTMIVLSRSLESADLPADVCAVRSLDDAIDRVGEASEAFVIGGAAVYAEALPRADRMHLTRVHAEVEGDVRFPAFDPARWERVAEERHEADDRHAFAFTFQELRRV